MIGTANFLVDAVISTTDTSNTGNSAPHSVPKGKVINSQGEAVRVTTLLKGLQPQKVVPSKDRGKDLLLQTLYMFQAMKCKNCSFGLCSQHHISSWASQPNPHLIRA